MTSTPVCGWDKVSSTVRRAHTDPQEFEIAGIPVTYEDNSFAADTWNEWETLLDEWLPRLTEAGWLDGLNGIKIGKGYMEIDDAGGEYHHNDMLITFPQDPTYSGPTWVVGDTKEYALIHEATHHAHIDKQSDRQPCDVTLEELNLWQYDVSFRKYRQVFDRVSEYATSNYLEAVAETSAGIVLGHEYPSGVRQAYRALEGPTPIRNWEPPLEEDPINETYKVIADE